MARAQAEERLDRSVILGLVAMGLGVLVIANDFTALSVALPAIEKQFGVDVSTAQWIINGYALVFGVLIVTGGRLADMFGRRRVFFLGATIFATFSLLGGVSPSIGMLLAARAVMGVGGALMWPAILGMTYEILPQSKAGLAGGLILGAAGFGNAMGPLIGGFLTGALSWRWIFFVNLPVAAFAMLVTWRVVHVHEEGAADHRIDYLGVATLTIGLVSLLLALDQGTDLGWADLQIVALFVMCAVFLAGFVFVERRAGAKALIPRDVLKSRQFLAACLTVLLMSAIFFASLLYLPQFMLNVLHYSPVKGGAGLLPMMVTFAVASFVAGPLYPRFGPKVIVSIGAAFLTVGIFLLSLIDQNSGYAALVPGMIVLGVGVGLFYSSITTAAVTALDPSRSSLAGGIVYMFQIAGGSIGLGLNTAILASGSLVAGIQTAFRVDAALALCGLIVSILFVGGTVDRERLFALRHHHHFARPIAAS